MLKKLDLYKQQYKILYPFFRSFGFKLFIFIASMLFILVGVNTWYNIRTQERQLVEEVLMWTDNIAQTVKYSTRIHMLENNKEKVQETINYIAQNTEQIEQIRLFDKEGKIRKTTIQGERGEMVANQADHCSLCHIEGKFSDPTERNRHTRIMQSRSGDHRVVSLTYAIDNEESCSIKCHQYHPETKKVLGVFEVTMSLQNVDEKIADYRRRLILISVISFIVIIINLGLMLFYFLIRPLNALLNGIHSLSVGDFKAEIPVYSNDEFGLISQSFNNMVEKLRKEVGYRKLLLYDSALPDQQKGEKTVQENEGIKHNGQGHDSLGTSFEEIYERIQDQTHMKLVRSVKLASLGQLSAGIAHEINNPLTAVLSYSSLLLEKAKTPKEKKWLTVIVDETKRCRNIVAGLLEFARQSTPEKIIMQVNNIIKRSISLVENKESFHNIDIIKKFDPNLPKVKVDGGQIYQVLTNLLINAMDAMEGKGTLTVESKVHTIESKVAEDRHFVEISVTDTGPGISQKNMERLFDPFFTTKGPTGGTGLGLSICFGIIKRHKGNITVRSEVGKGSTFIIHLPVEKENEDG